MFQCCQSTVSKMEFQKDKLKGILKKDLWWIIKNMSLRASGRNWVKEMKLMCDNWECLPLLENRQSQFAAVWSDPAGVSC